MTSKVSVAWDNDDQNTVRLTLYPGHTIEELYEAGARAADLIRSVTHTVHAIWLWEPDAVTPKDGFFSFTKYMMDEKPANLGISVYVIGVQRGYHQALVELAKSVSSGARFAFGKNLFYAANLDEARGLIAARIAEEDDSD